MQRLRLTIAQRIWVGFGALILFMLVYAIGAHRSVQKNQAISHAISEQYSPAFTLLNDLYNAVDNTGLLTRNWILSDKYASQKDKSGLRLLQEQKIPSLDESIRKLTADWDAESRRKYEHLMQLVNDSLVPAQRSVMQQLPDESSFSNTLLVYELAGKVQEGGSLSLMNAQVLDSISDLVDRQRQLVNSSMLKLDESYHHFGNMLEIMTVLLILLAVIIAILIIGSLVRPISYIKGILQNMSMGILPDDDISEGHDEIGQMSHALNGLVRALKDISDFSVQVGRGNFESDFKPLSEKDILGNALVEMREELKKAAIDIEKRKKEDDQRNWATQGMARFGEILRQDNNDITEFSQNIISHLVKYLDANQGGLFLVNNDDPGDVFIELQAFYAYNKKKYLQKRINQGEGLVGRCLQEKETIYLTDIPKDYIRITSGLGDDNPRSLILVPLAVNEQVFGVIEIASFSEFQPYQVEFMEKLAASIASTVNTVQINMQTAHLLEQSKQQAEEMSSQEEEMRQNMEELRATQEQSTRREEQLQKKVEELQAKLADLQK